MKVNYIYLEHKQNNQYQAMHYDKHDHVKMQKLNHKTKQKTKKKIVDERAGMTPFHTNSKQTS
jgi:hypothetical protein